MAEISKEDAYKQLAQAVEMIEKLISSAQNLASEHKIPFGLTRGLGYSLAAPDPHGLLREIQCVGDLDKLALQANENEDNEGEAPPIGNLDYSTYLEPIYNEDEHWVTSSICW